jgi:hypothetical protein
MTPLQHDNLQAVWEVWCPAWWLDSGERPRIAVDDLITMTVSFDFVGSWHASNTGVTNVELIEPGRYEVAAIEVVQGPDVGHLWAIDLRGNQLITDTWHPDTFGQARQLRAGDKISGVVELSIDPTLWIANPLRVLGIRVRTGPWVWSDALKSNVRDLSAVAWERRESIDKAYVNETDPEILLDVRFEPVPESASAV